MRFSQFRDKAKNYPFFRSNTFAHWTDNPVLLRRQVTEWVQKGYILQLKRGVYTLRNDDRAAPLSVYTLANQLYTPSYISLETALSYYGFIPERVQTITSICNKKTQAFSNPYGHFTYRHIKNVCYGGFITRQDEYGNNFFIATPEKTLVDFLYLESLKLSEYNEDIFEQSYRLQNLSSLVNKKLLEWTQPFAQPKLTKLITLLIKHKKKYA